MSFLFNEIVFGPVSSRRFGVSLGINLLPDTMKYCTFNCVYCECGLTSKDQDSRAKLYPTGEVISALEERFRELHEKGLKPDNITYAGNGEPTIHPGFPQIIEKTISLRDIYFPDAKITVLSNSTRINEKEIRDSLMKIDNNVLKLDAGSEAMFQAINRPLSPVTLGRIVQDLQKFEGKVIIQTLFIKGRIHDVDIDNTTDEEVNLWLEHLSQINPSLVMLYSISRATPEDGLIKVNREKLESIAEKVRALKLEAEVYN
ncbi:MAG TPA: radical SAM protein [Lentimicrobium sp.]|nr:radical SAM protein [Lentimicrobium sp.]